MKRTTTFFLLILLVLTNEVIAQLKDEVGHTVTQWSEWSTTVCHKGIAWRNRQNFYGGNNGYTWEYEVKNNYGRQVTFSFKFGENGSAYRRTLTPNQVFKNTALPNANNFEYAVYSVCFSSDGRCNDCYSPCDNGTPNIPNCNSSSTSSNTNSFNGSNQNSSQQTQQQNIANQQEQERQQQELKRQQDAQRTAAYVDLGVQTIKSVSGLISALKEDKLAKIEEAKNEAVQKAASEEMERYWVIANNHANEKNTVGYENAIQIMLPYAEAGKINGPALTTIGYWYWAINDFSNAFKWYSEAATKNDSQAMFNLGVLYKNGQGVTPNIRTSIEWFKKACMYGNLEACKKVSVFEYAIGVAYYNLKTIDGYRKAIGIIKPYTEYSLVNNKIIDGNLLFFLGLCYSELKDYSEAQKWYEEAAGKFNEGAAMNNLGWLYENDLITYERFGYIKNKIYNKYDETKEATVANLYKKACDLGITNGCDGFKRINKIITDNQEKTSSKIPIETSKEIESSISVQDIINKNIIAIGGLEKINNIRTLTQIYEYKNDEFRSGTTKNITAEGISYYEHTNKYGTVRSLSNGLEGFEIINGKKTKLRKEMKFIKNFKPTQSLLYNENEYKLGKIETIDGVEHYTINKIQDAKENPSKNTYSIYFNSETGLKKCLKTIYYDSTKEMEKTSYTYYEDYRVVEGILFPFTELEVGIKEDQTYFNRIKTFKKIAINDMNEESNLK